MVIQITALLSSIEFGIRYIELNSSGCHKRKLKMHSWISLPLMDFFTLIYLTCMLYICWKSMLRSSSKESVVVLLFVFVVAFLNNSIAITVQQDVFINEGTLLTADGPIHALSFNSTALFEVENVVMQLMPNDTLVLTVHNTHNQVHGFKISNTSFSISNIAPGGSTSISIMGLDEGFFTYYDPLSWGTYLGAACGLQVGFVGYQSFYWNIHEYQSTWNDSLSNGLTPTGPYIPDHFTINGLDYPASLNDSSVVIRGNVSDTLLVFVCNTGSMSHSIHSHGFHGTIEYSSKYPMHVGREKDSFPVLPMETLVIAFVVHQEGLYPIHDHNLVAATSGGNYPGGMISLFDISP